MGSLRSIVCCWSFMSVNHTRVLYEYVCVRVRVAGIWNFFEKFEFPPHRVVKIAEKWTSYLHRTQNRVCLRVRFYKYNFYIDIGISRSRTSECHSRRKIPDAVGTQDGTYPRDK